MTAPLDGGDSFVQQIGRRIRAVRLRRLITQVELARALGIERTTLTKYERGSRSMTVEMLVQIARALQVAPSVLLDDALPLESEEVREIMRRLVQRPDVVPQVLDMLDVMTRPEDDVSKEVLNPG